MTTKRRKRLAIVLLTIIAGVVAYGLLNRNDEPKYQGRYLSDWLEQYWVRKDWVGVGQSEAEVAVQNIGTNALPYLMKWIAYKPSAWRTNLRKKLPAFITTRKPVVGWLDESEAPRRRLHATLGFMILKTNAVSAMPELVALMKGSRYVAGSTFSEYSEGALAMFALTSIGPPTIPALMASLAHPNWSHRVETIYALRGVAAIYGTNACLPLLMETLNHDDFAVRLATTNIIREIAPQLLTNVPAI